MCVVLIAVFVNTIWLEYKGRIVLTFRRPKRRQRERRVLVNRVFEAIEHLDDKRRVVGIL